MSKFFFPELQAVEALAPYRLRTRWHTGEVLEVDVSGILHQLPELSPLLEPATFARAHVGEWGGTVEWFPRSRPGSQVMKCSASGCAATDFPSPLPPLPWA